MSKLRPVEIIKEDLEKARARLKEVQEKGNDALSAYDLSLGYDAEFYLIRCPMLASHVSWYEKELAEAEGLQLVLF